MATAAATASRAMTEQSTAANQIVRETESMRRQSDQVAKAVTEQTQALREMTQAMQAISRQINLITRANREDSAAAAMILGKLREVGEISRRHTQGVQATQRASAALAEQAQSLTTIVDRMSTDGRRR